MWKKWRNLLLMVVTWCISLVEAGLNLAYGMGCKLDVHKGWDFLGSRRGWKEWRGCGWLMIGLGWFLWWRCWLWGSPWW